MGRSSAGLVLLALLAWHTVEKVQTGLLPEMFWACHIATGIAALGWLAGRPALAVFGGLFHLVCGLPAWLLETAYHGTTLSSTALHLVTPGLGLWAARRHGVPAWAPLAGVGLWLTSQLIGRALSPELNVNLAWRPFDVWPAGTPVWVSHAANLVCVGGALAALRAAAPRIGFARA